MADLLPTFDLVAASAAVEALDADAAGLHMRELGIAIGPEALLAYANRFDGSRLVEQILDMIYRARHGAHGYAHNGTDRGFLCLAVRHGDRYVVGIQRALVGDLFPKAGWKMGRWYRDPARNLATVAAWAADPARATDALAVPIVGERAAPTADARGAELLAAVIADPDDADARLVYADWLLERGDARGDLIRAHGALADLAVPFAVRRALRDRATDLEDTYRSAIAADVAPHVEAYAMPRGLVERVVMTVPKLARFGAAIVANHPIRELRAGFDSAKHLARLATAPLAAVLARVSTLELAMPVRGISNPIGPPAMALPGVRRLQLERWNEDDLVGFLRALSAPALDALELCGHNTYGVPAIAATMTVPGLRTLALRDLWAGHEPRALIEAIANAVDRRGLVRVELGVEATPETFVALVQAILAAPDVAELSLARSSVDPAAIEALVAHGQRLVTLAVSCGPGLVALVPQLHRLPALRTLEIRGFIGATPGRETVGPGLAAAPASLATIRWPDCRLPEDEQAAIAATRRFAI